MSRGNPRKRAAPKKRVRSRKQAAASRRNGARGGRPAGELPDHLVEQLTAPPIDKPLEQPAWAANVLLLLTQARLEGHPGVDTLAREVRANFAVMSKLQNQVTQFKAARVLKEEQEGRDVDDGPEEEEVDASTGTATALRSDPT